MNPSADGIATFVEVVRKRSLSAAGRSLGLPKSTISRRLLRLEQQLRTKLLHRDARSFTLTSAGREFYGAVFGAVDALEVAVDSLEQSSQEPRGSIRLTAPPDLGRMVLSEMLVAFMERYPEIALDLVFTNRLVDLAQEGVDLAVRAGRVMPPGLIARKLCDSELQLAASIKHDLGQLGEDVRALEGQPFVLYRAAARTQQIRLERGQHKRRQQVDLSVSGRLNVDDYASLAELVAAGHGLGLMPAVHVQEGVRARRLVRIFPEWSSPSSQLYLVYSTRQQPARVRLLAEFLREAFSRVSSV